MARNVGELRKLLEGLPDGMSIISPAPDHSFRFGEVHLGVALYDRPSRILSEDISTDGEDRIGEHVEGLGVRIQALITS